MRLGNKVFVILLAVAVLLLAIGFLIVIEIRKTEEVDSGQVTMSIVGEEFKLEVADTPTLRARGLMGRSVLGENEGMLFVFDRSGIYPFWMKNTLIPLDIIWMNDKGEVVYIKKNARPCENIVEALCRAILPRKIARYVIELNGGIAAKLGVQPGDPIKLPKEIVMNEK